MAENPPFHKRADFYGGGLGKPLDGKNVPLQDCFAGFDPYERIACDRSLGSVDGFDDDHVSHWMLLDLKNGKRVLAF